MSWPQPGPSGPLPPGPPLPPGRPGGWVVLRPVPPPLRRPQAFAYPLVTIVLGSIVLVVVLLQVAVTGRDAGTGLFAIVLVALAAAAGGAVLRWLDRWEPEPPHLLAAAFFWGAGVVPLTGLVTGIIDAASTRGSWQHQVFQAVFGELFKLCFLLLVLLASRRGRGELTSLADAVVYAGFVGLGQWVVVGLQDLGGRRTWRGVLEAAWENVLLGAYAPVVAAMVAAIGLWLAVVSPPPRRFVAPFLGLAAALSLSLWSDWAGDLLAVPVRVAALAGLAWFLRRALRDQDQVVARHLPHLVGRGWVDPADAAWLASLEGRRDRRRAARAHGRFETARVDALRDNVSELAFVRERLDAQHAAGRPPGLELLAQHDELVGLLLDHRRAAGG